MAVSAFVAPTVDQEHLRRPTAAARAGAFAADDVARLESAAQGSPGEAGMIELEAWRDRDRAMSGAPAPPLPPMLRAATSRPTRRVHIGGSCEPVSVVQHASITETRRHARRLAAFSAALGRHINLPDADLGLLRTGSLLHDVGKNSLPPQILFKCGRLSPDEFAAVKYHPVIGDLLCARVPALTSVRPIVRHHHERLDGSGYPDGLRGNDIPLLAQIVGVVDVYDALVCTRPYKPAYDPIHAMDILRHEVELGWRRPDLVSAFIAVLENGDADRLLAATTV